MARGIYTPPAFSPKAPPARNEAAMKTAFGRVTKMRELHDEEVTRARNQQARLIVDAMHGRWSYQVKYHDLKLSFGEWVIQKRTLAGTYATISVKPVMYAYDGIAYSALTDTRYRFFEQQDDTTDWLTPLVKVILNRRVEEDYFKVRVTSYTVPLVDFRDALASLYFARDLVPGHFAKP